MAENDTRAVGPNIKRLMAHKMALDAVPHGGGFDSALRFLSSKDNVTSSARVAAIWVRTACDVVRAALEPNPFKNSTDEEIATYLLEQMALKTRDSDPQG